jgi:sec-independent protein translocase protein TatC
VSIAGDEDEIEASRAPLMEHLVELRGRLIRCAWALGLGFVVCFAFAKQIYLFLLGPFERAAQLMAVQKAGGAGGGWFNPDLVLALLGLKATPHVTVQAINMVFTAPLEFFFTKVKLAGFGAIVVAFPVLAWQLYRFVAPGLYKRERNAFLPFLSASPILFLMGAALVYFIMLPFVLWFSLNQQIVGTGAVSVSMLPKVSDYLDLVTTLLLAFGLCFQLPVILALLGMAGIVSSSFLASGRRYAIVAVFLVAAILTPPDPFSMMSLAIPGVLLYEISIWCVWLIERRRKREDAAADAAGT